MQDSTVTCASRARQLAIFGCAAAALLAGTTSAKTLTDVISGSPRHPGASLPTFSITVEASGSRSGSAGSASLQWTAPTTNTNGSALTDLAGYHIYYGRSPSSMTTAVTVANPGTTSYTIGNLASGTWYFAMNAYTTSGLDSALTNADRKSVP